MSNAILRDHVLGSSGSPWVLLGQWLSHRVNREPYNHLELVSPSCIFSGDGRIMPIPSCPLKRGASGNDVWPMQIGTGSRRTDELQDDDYNP